MQKKGLLQNLCQFAPKGPDVRNPRQSLGESEKWKRGLEEAECEKA